MAEATTVGVTRSVSLTDLNKLVDQQEQILGPLVAIGNDGTQTLLTFDVDQDPPANLAVISVGGPPTGAAVIATGLCFVAGVMTQVTASRRTE
jgi:hypothetical protein